jgi:hypothetical protein
MSQEAQILNHLQAGKALTPIQALNYFSCFRLAARIHDLRCKGYDIVSTRVKRGEAEVAMYTLKS